MQEITITPDMLLQYAKADMTKNEIVMHLAIRAIAVDGKVRRNLNRLARQLGKDPKSLREAETRLRRHRLLREHLVGGHRYWYVYALPIGSIPQQSPDTVTGLESSKVKSVPRKQSLRQRIRGLLAGTTIADYDLEGESDA